ncbi:MAG: rhodanese-like domain-containing protein [Candidatus Marinimicrobia bacterium]|nr:rhodanese-like domain-containing protein [Candidatus Neomarinimicrobiota bacterium]MCF7827965.1 rhodanese-like domain-containing protein [Candidatus Neomarinimicrobiota bacterium]MCF7879280.1 rhodanese-like domain-containing protein [Candidatus Neomarinimicrobiota bacterium]
MSKKTKYYIRNVLLTVGSLVVLGAIVYTSFAQQGSFKNLSVQEVKERMESGENDYVLIDVRRTQEYTGQLGHLENAPLYPIQNLDIQYHELEQYQKSGKDIILYCRSGNRSRRAAEFLHKQGFDNIYNMEGGMRRWNAEFGRPAGSDTPPPNRKD